MKTMTSTNLDVVARTLDLSKVIAEASGPLAAELFEWFGRQRLSKPEVQWTLGLCQDIAAPNYEGTTVLDAMAGRIVKPSSFRDIELIMPNSLGRSVIADTRLTWLATSVAVLLKDRNMTYTWLTLSELLVNSKLGEGDPLTSLYMMRVRNVVTKMVDSIAMNSVNIGPGANQTLGLERMRTLPQQLEDLPKHALQPEQLGRSICEILKADASELIVQMDYCVSDLIAWLYYHWHGTLMVYTGNKTAFEQVLGGSGRILRLTVTNPHCQQGCPQDGHEGTIRVASCQGFDTSYPKPWEAKCRFKTGSDRSSARSGSYPSELYDIRNPFFRPYLKLNEKESKQAQRSAQEIVYALINQRVRVTDSTLSLRLDPTSDQTFRWWLKMAPSILQLNLDLAQNEAKNKAIRPLYTPEDMMLDSADSDLASHTSSVDVQDVTEHYYELTDAMAMAGTRCECGCKRSRNTKDGCLQTVMLGEIVILIGHALAEAAGATRVSNLTDGPDGPKSIFDATIRLLDTIACQGIILWGDWFRLVATVITGIPSSLGVRQGLSDSGEVFGCTYGAISLFPAWFSIRDNVSLESSWSIRQVLGSPIGAISERAFYKPHVTNDAIVEHIPLIQIDGIQSCTADSDPTISCAVIQTTGSIHRLAFWIQAGKSFRCVNPNDIFKSHIHAIRPSCNHDTLSHMPMHPWRFSDILQQWAPGNLKSIDTAHVAIVADSFVQRNIAAALAGEGCVMQTQKCCFECAVHAALKHQAVLIPFIRSKRLMIT
jgi:hypothetical protein